MSEGALNRPYLLRPNDRPLSSREPAGGLPGPGKDNPPADPESWVGDGARPFSSDHPWGGVLVWVGCPLAGIGFLALASDLLDYAVLGLGGTLPLRSVLIWTAIAAVGSAVAAVGDLARRQSRAAAVPA